MAELPKIDSKGLRLAKTVGAARVSSVARVSLTLLEDGPCTHCGAVDRQEAAWHCTILASPQRACHGERGHG